MSLGKKLLKESFVYSLASILEKLVSILLIPIYTTYLTVTDYGELQFILVIGAFFMPLIDGGLSTSFWRFRSDETEYSKGEVSLNVVIGQLAIGITILAILVCSYLTADQSFFGLLLILYLASRVVLTVYNNTLLVLQANHRVVHYLLVSLLYVISMVACNIVLVSVYRLNFAGVIYSAFGVTAIFSILFSWPLIKEMTGKIQLPLLKELLRYGMPLAYANLAAVVITFSDVLLLKWLSNEHEVGLYTFSYKFAMLVNVLLVVPFFKGWNPIRWEVYHRRDGKFIYGEVYKNLIVFLPPIALAALAGAIALAGILTRNPEYFGGLLIAPTVGSAYVFYALYYFNSMGMLFTNKTNYITLIMIFSAVVNIILNLLLIPTFGMYGAAISTLMSYILMAVLSLLISQRLYPIHHNYISEATRLIVLVMFVLGLLLLPDNFANKVYPLVILLSVAAIGFMMINLMIDPKLITELKRLREKADKVKAST